MAVLAVADMFLCFCMDRIGINSVSYIVKLQVVLTYDRIVANKNAKVIYYFFYFILHHHLPGVLKT